jgi:hypothetical protein
MLCQLLVIHCAAVRMLFRPHWRSFWRYINVSARYRRYKSSMRGRFRYIGARDSLMRYLSYAHAFIKMCQVSRALLAPLVGVPPTSY